MAHETREPIREDLGKGRFSKPSGIVRLWVYDTAQEKVAFYNDTPPAAVPYETHTDIEKFGASLIKRFRKSPLWDWYSRSTTWAKHGQAFVQVYAYRTDNETAHREYEIYGQVRQRKDTPPTTFFVEAVDYMASHFLKNYQVFVVDALGVRLLHAKRTSK